MKKTHKRAYLYSFLFLFAMLLISVAIGAVNIPPVSLLSLFGRKLFGLAVTIPNADVFNAILFQVRVPHSMLVLLTGAALGGSGAAFQGLFRNPLADPYLIGVASGAGLGAVLAMSVGVSAGILGLYAVPAAAFLGATLTVLLVYQLARVGQTVPTSTLILAGVAVGSFASALTSYLMLSSQGELRRALSWLMGGGSLGGWEPVFVIFPYVALGLGFLLLCGHTLNVLQFGDEQAQQLGLPVERAKLFIILAASLSTAAAVAFSGIIGFIGLIIPHAVRFLVGADYKHLVPLSILGGASALLAADFLARVIMAPQVLPVGIVTALAGAPFFLWLLKRARDQAFW